MSSRPLVLLAWYLKETAFYGKEITLGRKINFALTRSQGLNHLSTYVPVYDSTFALNKLCTHYSSRKVQFPQGEVLLENNFVCQCPTKNPKENNIFSSITSHYYRKVQIKYLLFNFTMFIIMVMTIHHVTNSVGHHAMRFLHTRVTMTSVDVMTFFSVMILSMMTMVTLMTFFCF